MERRSIFSERSSAGPYSDEEEDGYDSPKVRRRGASVDDFLKGSELGKQVSSLALLLQQVLSECFVQPSSVQVTPEAGAVWGTPGWAVGKGCSCSWGDRAWHRDLLSPLPPRHWELNKWR